MSRPLEPGIRGYDRWQKALRDDETLRYLAGECQFDLRHIAWVIGTYGAHGRGCFATAQTVAEAIGCTRNVIGKYRSQLIDLGWFTVVSRNGGSRRRALVLDISLPEAVSGQEAAQARRRGEDGDGHGC